ncbi:hypothetical protein ACPV3S_15885 [Photobacterium damselae]|uniref:hypothetical protein n=1 Tax=Photobacterium damselae TaxID=38293 RepID=UPI004067DBE6
MNTTQAGVLTLLAASILTGCANTPPKPDYRFAKPVQINQAVLDMAHQYQAPLPMLRPIDVAMKPNQFETLKPHNSVAVTGAKLPAKYQATQPPTALPKTEPTKLVTAQGKQLGAISALGLKAPSKPFAIWPQERYIDAINRWMRQSGFDDIAWQLPTSIISKLEQSPERTESYRGTFRVAIRTLSRELGVPLYLQTRFDTKQAAIVPWEMPTQIVTVRGKTLLHAMKNLAADYGWNFVDGKGSQGQSYLARDNFAFPAAYPLATPVGDISMALSQILAPFPVRAELLGSTHTLFILDEK